MRKYIVMVTCLLIFSMGQSQNVGINNNTPHASALLDLAATNKGLLVPRMSTAQRLAIINPATGLWVYDLSVNSFYYFDGTLWRMIGNQPNAWTITGNSGTAIANHFLGTTDSMDLAIKTNNNHRIRISANGKVGIGTVTPKAQLHVADSSVLFTAINGAFNPANTNLGLPTPGSPPASGPGTRMMWYADKAALRIGGITDDAGWLQVNEGTWWDKDSIGNFSLAAGLNCMAQGIASQAMGYYCQTLGTYGTTIGYRNLNWGNGASFVGGMFNTGQYNYGGCFTMGWINKNYGTYGTTALGNNNYVDTSAYFGASAIGDYNSVYNGSAIALGSYNTASFFGNCAIGSGNYAGGNTIDFLGNIALGGGCKASSWAGSIAAGYYCISHAPGCVAVGLYNDSISWSQPDSLSPLNPVFMVGNGDDLSVRRNALTVLKNGNAGLGVNMPKTLLDVNGAVTIRDSLVTVINGTNTVTVNNRSFMKIASSTVATTTYVQLSNGAQAGQLLVLMCSSNGTNGFTINDSTAANVNLSTNLAFTNGDTVSLIWDGYDWIQLSYSDN